MSGVQKKVKRTNKDIFLAAAIVIIAVVIFVCVFSLIKNKEEKKMIEDGIQYLTELENRDVNTIRQNVKAAKPTIDWDAAVEDESLLWAGFDDAVIVGDSRVIGFYYYEFLPEEQVLAEKNGNIQALSNVTEQLVSMSPERVYITFGVHDIANWSDVKDCAAAYEEELTALHEALPDSEIYINSILPILEHAQSASPNYSRWSEYNDAIEDLCEEKEWMFIDNTQMANEHKEFYEPNGLHVGNRFFKYWAANMLAGVQE